MNKGDKLMSRILFGMGLLTISAFGISYGLSYFTKNEVPPFTMQFAYPVTSIDPNAYDDWESVFIGNHIYPRLLPDSSRPSIISITDTLKVECERPEISLDSEKCTTVKITFTVKPFTDCTGKTFTIENIRKEFESLLSSKSWALPGWKRCNSQPNEFCVQGRNTLDVERRMKNVNFRFGWSQQSSADTVFGAGPYCLKSKRGKDGGFEEGELFPNQNNSKLPTIAFHVSKAKETDFNAAIYGSHDLLQDKRKNVQAHTPLAYYVITNPRLEGLQLPWNTAQTKQIFHSFLVEHEVFFSDGAALSQLAPSGKALEPQGKSVSKGSLQFVIPDYLPECQKLADTINTQWGTSSKAKAICTDIVSWAMDKVKSPKRDWDGFIVGLSASDPGRDAIRIQYFSPHSPDSWTYNSASSENFYYLVGMGQSIVTVDGVNFCDIKPNLLGLGDIFINDFLPCSEAR